VLYYLKKLFIIMFFTKIYNQALTYEEIKQQAKIAELYKLEEFYIQ